MNRWPILFCSLLLFAGMLIGEEDKATVDKLAVECSTGNPDACKTLADIAKNGKNEDIRKAAVKRLTDQNVLTDIAKNNNNWHIRKLAVEKLTDQALLADIAKKDRGIWVRMIAVNRLTDPAVLAKIAMEDLFLGYIAIGKLADQTSLSKVSANDKDLRVQLLLKYIAAFDIVPTEHRERLLMELLPAIRVLSNRAVVSEVGNITSIKTEWNITSQCYIGSLQGYMDGEIFTCSIYVQKLPEPLSHTWSTDFPPETYSLDFLSADVNASDLLINLIEKTTNQTLLTEIARNSEFLSVGKAAVYKLTDQTLLADIAKNDEDEYVRLAAEIRLKALQRK